MECQRHNAEAVIQGLNDKLKEKDKEHRFVSKKIIQEKPMCENLAV